MTKDKALKLALEALTHIRPSALTSFYTIGDRDKAIIAIKEALAQPEQEPLKYTVNVKCGRCGSAETYDMTIDTTPPQRTWVGLTVEERKDLCRCWSSPMDAIYATEAKLKELNA